MENSKKESEKLLENLKKDELERVSSEMTLVWKNINLEVKKNNSSLKILDNVSGYAKPKEITAIIGSSGAGKTSLLSIISGKVKENLNLYVKGSIYLNGTKLSKLEHYYYIRFVEQESNLYECMSAYEILYFQCKLRSNVSDKEAKQKVKKILDQFKLNSVAYTPIGGVIFRGLSGGEKKRVDIAAELIVCSSVLVLDEPTSGLDSYLAKVLIGIIKEVAMSGVTILLSIHQPGWEVLSMIDELIIMQEGYIIYQGRTFDSISYFANLGFEVPSDTNPSDYFMRLIKIEDRNNYSDKELRIMTILRNEFSKNQGQKMKVSINYLENLNKNENEVQDIFKTIKYLLWRELINSRRNHLINVIKYVQVFTHALFNIMLFYKLELNNKGLEDRRGLILRVLITIVGISIYSTAVMLANERRVIMKELSDNLYSLNSYLIMKIIGEIPTIIITCTLLVFASYYTSDLNQETPWKVWVLFLIAINTNFQSFIYGCIAAALCTHPIAASPYANVVSNTVILLSGAYTDPDTGPRFTRWLKNLCYLWFIRDAAFINEFDDLDYDEDVSPDPKEKFNYRGEIMTNLMMTFFHFVAAYILTFALYRYFLWRERIKL